jgi:hypothetical protein
MLAGYDKWRLLFSGLRNLRQPEFPLVLNRSAEGTLRKLLTKSAQEDQGCDYFALCKESDTIFDVVCLLFTMFINKH